MLSKMRISFTTLVAFPQLHTQIQSITWFLEQALSGQKIKRLTRALMHIIKP